MRPNVVVLGSKNDWLIKADATIDYFNIIHDALHLKYDVGIVRLQSIFRPKQTSSAIIDVWRLFDDGGLTLLLPYLLRRRRRWRNCQFRIFSCVPGEETDAERQHVAMISLLAKFRIKYTDLHVLYGLNKQPNELELQKFDQLVQAWQQNNESSKITEAELELDAISSNLPPLFFLRGNQKYVLTHYS
jgi:hypothetical protein